MGPALDCDVLVVGAGPTGSTLALLLAREGLSVAIAEREHDIYSLPRAAHIDHEAMRIFQTLGLADDIAGSSRTVARYDFLNRAGQVLLRFDKADAIGPGGWPASNMIHASRRPGVDARCVAPLWAGPCRGLAGEGSRACAIRRGRRRAADIGKVPGGRRRRAQPRPRAGRVGTGRPRLR